MNANLKDLLAALPQDTDEPTRGEADISERQVLAIFADLAQRRVPTGSLHRLWTMGELSTQITLAYAALWCKQWFSDASTQKQRLVDTNLRVALKLIHRLGYLRGAAAKVGQLLGSLPQIIPDQVVQTLDRFHFDAPPMHFSLLREMVRNELGRDPEDVFQKFEREPFAAASIGQVHRARLKSGEKVVVKIQYPGIARTIDADMRNISALLFPMRLGKDWDATRKQFEEIHTMLQQEVDYRREADNMRKVRKLFIEADGLVVPAVFEEYSTDRILTSEYLPGVHLPAYLRTHPNQAARNAFGAKIYEAWVRMYRAHMNYADPHVGNYLFMSDGRLGLLDFGCVRHLDADELKILRACEEMLNNPQVLPEVLRLSGADAKLLANPEYVDLMRQSCNWIMDPLRVGAFDFGDPNHLARGLEILSQITLKRYTRGHPLFIYWNRSVIGIRSLLYQLAAKVDLGAIFANEAQGQA